MGELQPVKQAFISWRLRHSAAFRAHWTFLSFENCSRPLIIDASEVRLHRTRTHIEVNR